MERKFIKIKFKYHSIIIYEENEWYKILIQYDKIIGCD